MGIGIYDGDALGDMLLRQSARCLKCNYTIRFESGVNLAKSKGINDNVVMCDHCMSVFTVYLVPGQMTLTKDVTGNYFTPQAVAGLLEEANRSTETNRKITSVPKPQKRLNKLTKELLQSLFCTIGGLLMIIFVVYSRLQGNDTASTGVIVGMSLFFLACLIWTTSIIKRIRKKRRKKTEMN
jgi:hypothetical protein